MFESWCQKTNLKEKVFYTFRRFLNDKIHLNMKSAEHFLEWNYFIFRSICKKHDHLCKKKNPKISTEKL